MEIRNVSCSDICQAKKLWKVSFGDSDEFIDFFFENKFESEKSLGIFDGQKLLSSLYYYDRNFVMQGNAYKSAFVAGCATLPSERNKGYMRSLFDCLASGLAYKGYRLCFLHPFLHSFYEKFGFETVTYVTRKSAEPVKPVPLKDIADIEAITDLYNYFASEHDCCFIRKETDIKLRIGELLADGGKVLLAEDFYALYYADDRINVIENTCRNEKDIAAMVAALSGYGKRIDYFSPGGEEKYTMCREITGGDRKKSGLCSKIKNSKTVIFEQY